MKKIFLFLMLLAVIAIIAFFVIMSNQQSEEFLTDGATLPASLCAKIPKVTVIHKEGCPACAVVIPRLGELEQELNMQFKYYDVAIVEDAQEIKELGLIPQYVPTVIINCKVFIGVRTKEEFKGAIMS